jgi:hypothetical protein
MCIFTNTGKGNRKGRWWQDLFGKELYPYEVENIGGSPGLLPLRTVSEEIDLEEMWQKNLTGEKNRNGGSRSALKYSGLDFSLRFWVLS